MGLRSRFPASHQLRPFPALRGHLHSLAYAHFLLLKASSAGQVSFTLHLSDFPASERCCGWIPSTHLIQDNLPISRPIILILSQRFFCYLQYHNLNISVGFPLLYWEFNNKNKIVRLVLTLHTRSKWFYANWNITYLLKTSPGRIIRI